MSSITLKRLSALSLLIGSAILIAGIVPTFFLDDNQASAAHAAFALVRLIGAILLVLGLPGVYAGGSTRAGVLGLLGFLCTILFLLMALATEPIFVFIFPFLATKAPAALNGGPPPTLFFFFLVDGVLEMVGGVLLGIAVLRSKIAPRWSGLVLIIGGLLSFFGSFLNNPIGDIGTIILVAGLIWLTVGQWSVGQTEMEMVTPPTSVRA